MTATGPPRFPAEHDTGQVPGWALISSPCFHTGAHLGGLGVLHHPSQMQTYNGAERRVPAVGFGGGPWVDGLGPRATTAWPY